MLTIEIRVARDKDEQNKDTLPAITFNNKPFLEITSINKLMPYEESDNEGSYLNTKQAEQQLIMITDFTIASFSGTKEEMANLEIGKNIELECWIKLQVNSKTEDEKALIHIPWKGSNVWLDMNPSIEDIQGTWIILSDDDSLRS